jgi:predicted amidohydrolase
MFRIAMVEAMNAGPNEQEINLSRAEKYIDEAADKGAKIVCFPELFPGPWQDTNLYDPLPRMKAKAKERNINVILGDIEAIGDADNGFYNIFWLVGKDGEVIGKYRRTTPHGPWLYTHGNFWHFNYKSANELPVFDIGDCKIGILMCSEVFAVELGRTLALKGAEIIFYPAAIPGSSLYETWGTLIKARAFENNAFTAVCKNHFGETVKDPFCLVAGPEGLLFEAKDAGVHVVDLDLDRLRWLRSNIDGYYEKLPYKTKPGVLTQWRRPELWMDVIGEPPL